MRPIEVPIPPVVRAMVEPGARAYRMGECYIIVGRTDRWHMSISHPTRYPTWDEIKTARYALIPRHVTMAMILPPPDEYLNVHQTTFHLWEIEEDGRR